MKIENSSVFMSGSGSTFKSYIREESLVFWAGGRRPGVEGQNQTVELSLAQPDIIELSDQAKALLARENGAVKAEPADQPAGFEISDKDKLKIRLIESLMESLTGRKFKFYILGKVKLGSEKTNFKINPGETAPQAPQRQGWGLDYNYHESYYEQQTMSFSAQGVIKTADGRELSFSVQLNMTREFAVQQDIRIRAGDAAVDPLVINYDGKAPELTETKFTFDLDSDGKEDRISFLRPGSGFLALDLNGDGIINNGRELFGPDSGDGFTELALYDSDGNQWIDENDEIYHRLRIWTKDAEGNDILMALGQKGIGAIYLGSIGTSFEMKDSRNNLQGELRKTGIFLNENGTAGTVQQIDLVV